LKTNFLNQKFCWHYFKNRNNLVPQEIVSFSLGWPLACKSGRTGLSEFVCSGQWRGALQNGKWHICVARILWRCGAASSNHASPWQPSAVAVAATGLPRECELADGSRPQTGALLGLANPRGSRKNVSYFIDRWLRRKINSAGAGCSFVFVYFGVRHKGWVGSSNLIALYQNFTIRCMASELFWAH
jgi:hypothetical protein